MSAFAAKLKIFSNCVELAVNENAAMVALEAFTEGISVLILLLKSEFAVTYEGGLCQVFRCESKGHANKTILLVCKCLSCAFSSGGDLHLCTRYAMLPKCKFNQYQNIQRHKQYICVQFQDLGIAMPRKC